MKPLLLILTKKELIFCRYSSDFGRIAKKLGHPNVGLFNQLRGISVVYGDLKDLGPKVSGNFSIIHFIDNIVIYWV